jgi:hypothetical protein
VELGNSFTTVFEISGGVNGIRSDFLLRIGIGLAALIGGIITTVARKKTNERWFKQSFGPIFMIAWAVVWIVAHLLPYLYGEPSIASLLQVYRTKAFKITEGAVEVKHEQPYSGHTKGDIVVIGGKEFEVNFFKANPSYNVTIAHGGALRPGTYARVSYYNDTILRVEIREPNQTAERITPPDNKH